MTYTDPIITNISIGVWMTEVDTATGGWFGFMMLISIYVIVFLASFFGYATPAKSATIAGFASLLIGLMLVKMDVVGLMEILIIAIITAIGVVGIYIEGKQGY